MAQSRTLVLLAHSEGRASLKTYTCLSPVSYLYLLVNQTFTCDIEFLGEITQEISTRGENHMHTFLSAFVFTRT